MGRAGGWRLEAGGARGEYRAQWPVGCPAVSPSRQPLVPGPWRRPANAGRASMQMPRPPAAAVAATTAAARRPADLQRVHQRIEALGKEPVDLGHDAAELLAVEVALHEADHVFHQQVTLHLHD